MKEEYLNSILLSYSFSDIKIKEHKTNCGSYYSFEAKRNNHEIHFVYSGSAKTLVKKILSYSEMSFSSKEDKMNYNDLKEELEEFIEQQKRSTDKQHDLFLGGVFLCLNYLFAIIAYMYFKYASPIINSETFDFITTFCVAVLFIVNIPFLFFKVMKMEKE